MRRDISRRRFLAITAAAAGAAVPHAGLAGAGVPLHVWNGTALGARASLRLYHPDSGEAGRLIDTCRAEIERLERIFSLYRSDSAISRLNANGALKAPPLDLVRLLDESRRVSMLTGGAFDATVQPLWLAFARHFSDPDADAAGPSEAEIRQALSLVGSQDVEIAPDRISFARPGMAVTLNGIAQGYVTDRVAELLRRAGLENVLVDLGEARALGSHADGRPWRAALADPVAGGTYRTIDLADRALATSAPSGFLFDRPGRFGHILDPLSGRPAAGFASVTVLAPEATLADALSTAFVQMPCAEIARVLAARPQVSAFLLRIDGRHEALGVS